jgi:hypothetical protein
LQTVPLQHGERFDFTTFETRNKHHFHQPESLGNRRTETIILVQTESETFRALIIQQYLQQKQKGKPD